MSNMYNEPRFKDGWGESIREFREYRGYSQREFAEKMGVSQGTVCKWEREIMIPSILNAIDISIILRVDVETIFSV